MLKTFRNTNFHLEIDVTLRAPKEKVGKLAWIAMAGLQEFGLAYSGSLLTSKRNRAHSSALHGYAEKYRRTTDW